MKKYIPYIVILVLVVLLFNQCSRTSQLKNEKESAISALSDSITTYKNKLGYEVASKSVLQGDKKSLELLLTKNRDSLGILKEAVRKFKKVDAAVRIVTETRIDTFRIPYTVDGQPFSIPFKLNKKYFSINGLSTNEGLTINSLSIPNTQSIVLGEKKTGFFRTKYMFEVTNSNPYVKVLEMDAYSYTERNKRFGLGPTFAYGLGADGFGWFVGAGINYSVVRF